MAYLVHHGIKGQSWGVRNGPPYPLGIKIHRKVIAKAKETGEKVKETSTKVKQSVDNYRKNFDKKKALKIGAIAAGAALTAVGGYYLYKSGALNKLVTAGKAYGENVIDDIGKEQISSSPAGSAADKLKRTAADAAKAGLSPEAVKDLPYLKTINEVNGHTNCPSTTMSYILNRLYGGDFKAKADSDIADEFRTIKGFKSFFKEGSFKEIDPDDFGLPSGANGSVFNQKLIDLIPNGSTGVLCFNFTNGHLAEYEKTKDGIFTMTCTQNDRFAVGADGMKKLIDAHPIPYKYCYRILDLTNSELSEEGLRRLNELVR